MLYITHIKFKKIQSLFFFNESTKAMSLQNGKIILARFIRDFVLDHKTGRSRQYGPVIVQSLLRFPFFFERISELYLKYVHTIIVFRCYIDRRIYTFGIWSTRHVCRGKCRQILCLRVIEHAKCLNSKLVVKPFVF